MKSKQLVLIVTAMLVALVVNAQEPLENKSSTAQILIKKKISQNASLNSQKKQWHLNKKSAVKIKGVDLGEKGCALFNIQFSESLSYQIQCGEFSSKKELALTNTSTHTVTRKDGYTTITQYGYLIKKPQISQLDQSTLRVPYVSQIIHINQTDNNEIAFYLESFKVDEFGRIVQDKFIQAYSLSSEERRVSAYKAKIKGTQ